MDNTHLVGMVDALQRLAEKRDSSADGHPSSAPQLRIKGLSAHELHHHKIIIDFAHETVQVCDVWVRELGQGNSFGPEPFDDMGLTGKLGPQRLDGYFALEHQVDALIHGSHA